MTLQAIVFCILHTLTRNVHSLTMFLSEVESLLVHVTITYIMSKSTRGKNTRRDAPIFYLTYHHALVQVRLNMQIITSFFL
ncbi:hypothetical protein H5410_062233 [Solanum commersonii]|uniref:Secreted protein n=1 Tax=Solanum commersonii TaxID=4109 RepID=A0A9J5W9V3_SOLCO|nr:hypothetical protein H5410_062233 [Solanum commersonii]